MTKFALGAVLNDRYRLDAELGRGFQHMGYWRVNSYPMGRDRLQDARIPKLHNDPLRRLRIC